MRMRVELTAAPVRRRGAEWRRGGGAVYVSTPACQVGAPTTWQPGATTLKYNVPSLFAGDSFYAICEFT